MTPEQTEFIFSIVVIGGVVAVGALIAIGLALVAIAVFNKVTRQKITKEIYDQKERENGQHKGGSRGK